MGRTSIARRRDGRPGPLDLRPHRRPLHRPAFDLLECRILPTALVVSYDLPTGDPEPGSLVPTPDGSLWYLMRNGDAVGRITPDGTVQPIPLGPPIVGGFLGFHGEKAFNSLTLGPDGNIWVVGFHYVDRVTPDGVVTSFDRGGAFDVPITNDPLIATGPDGALWYGGILGSIGRITTDGDVTLFPIPNYYNYITSIATGPDGDLWFTGARHEIGRMRTDGTLESIHLDDVEFVDDITVGPDGDLWYVINNQAQIGRITPEGEQTSFTVPISPTAYIHSLTVGPDGALWFSEGDTGQIGRITTDGLITEYPLPIQLTGGPSLGRPQGDIAFGDDGALWYSTGLYGLKLGPVDPITGGTSFTFERMHEIVRVDASQFVPIVTEAAPVSAVAGTEFEGPLATFPAVEPGELSGDFSASIDWGDGSTSAGVVAPDGEGGFRVEGSHTFEAPGSFTASVTLTPHRTSTLPYVLPAVVQASVTVSPVPSPTPPPSPEPPPDIPTPPVNSTPPEDPTPTAIPTPPDILTPPVIPTPVPDPIPLPVPDPVDSPATLPLTLSAPLPAPDPIVAPILKPLKTEADVAAPALAGVAPPDPAQGLPLAIPDSPEASTTTPTASRAAAESTIAPGNPARSSRARPVPTLGLPTPTLGIPRRSAHAAPRPARIARPSAPRPSADLTLGEGASPPRSVA